MPEKTKVLLIYENSPYLHGGIERCCRNILKLFENDESVSVSWISKENIAYRQIKLLNKVLFSSSQLKKKILENDCLHIHGWGSLATLQALFYGIKFKKRIIYTPHYHPLPRSLAKWLYFRLFIRPLAQKCSVIITLNNDDYAIFKQLNPHISRQYNFLISSFCVSTEQRIAKISDNNTIRRIILCVGRNESNKSLHYLNYLSTDRYEIHCVTDSHKNFKDGIIIHHNIDEAALEDLYIKADLLVVPSVFEAFSFAALEALSKGTPVLCSQFVRITDHLPKMSGITVFRYNSPEDFVNKIEPAMKQEVDINKVREIFSPARMKNELSAIYTPVTADNNSKNVRV